MSIMLEPSPHVVPFRRTRNALDGLIARHFQKLLKNWRSEGLVSFDPYVQCATPDTKSPTKDEERAAFISGGDLLDEIRISMSLGGEMFDWGLGLLARITDRGSFIYNGTERCLIAQLGHSPGVFFSYRERKNTAVSPETDVKYCRAEVRVQEGITFSFEQIVEAKGNAINVKFPAGRTVPLWPLCFALGIVDTEGSPLLPVSKSVKLLLDEAKQSFLRKGIELEKAIRELLSVLDLDAFVEVEETGKLNLDFEEVFSKVQDAFYTSQIGELGRAQLNRRAAYVGLDCSENSHSLTQQDLVVILEMLSQFQEGFLPEDDPWSLSNLRVRLAGDLLQDSLELWSSGLESRVRRKLEAMGGGVDESELIKLLQESNFDQGGKTLFTKLIAEQIFHSPLCQIIPRDQNNYLEAAALTRRVTFNGPGGIEIGHERDPRDFHWSHYGRLCPLDTPQSDDVGVTLSLTTTARVNSLGIIEARCREVSGQNGQLELGEEYVYISPWVEETQTGAWIAFPDQREAILSGQNVYAHKCGHVLESISADEVTYIHSDENDLYSVAASLIPYKAHTDSVRGVMTCSFLRQALSLEGAQSPRVGTGFESRLPEVLPFNYGHKVEGAIAYGKELRVGYLPWNGWNFEDAIVISESAAEALSSTHQYPLRPVRLLRTLADQELAFQVRKDQAKSIPEINLNHFDGSGIVKLGTKVVPGNDRNHGDYIVLEPGSGLSVRGDSQFIGHEAVGEKSGIVERIETLDLDKDGSWVRVILQQKHQAKIGDKLANRYGHKGVISKILPDEEMPYVIVSQDGTGTDKCSCGELRPHRHLQVLLNPLGVISRLNLGQLRETVEARSPELEDLPEKVPCYYRQAGGIIALDGEVLIGEQYLMKLDHNAADKVHGRSRVADAYSQFVQQPLKGRRLQGGQRMGEMEVWALMAHHATALMQEAMTIKSDNPRERTILFQSLMKDQPVVFDPAIPEALKTWSASLYGLGLDLAAIDAAGKSHDLLYEKISPTEIKGLKQSLLSTDIFLDAKISKGEVRTSLSSGREENKGFRYHSEGLESEQIFGPLKSFRCACGKYHLPAEGRSRRPRECPTCRVPLIPVGHRRHRMGHIRFARAIPNPYVLLTAVRKWRGMDCQSFMEDQPKFVFERYYTAKDSGQTAWGEVARFFDTAIAVSPEFRKALEEALGAPVTSVKPSEGDTEEDSQEWRTTLGRLHSDLVAEQGGYDSDQFISKMREQFGTKRKALLAVSGFMDNVLQSSELCSIDFLADLLQSDTDSSKLSLEILPVIPPPLRGRYKIAGRNQPSDLAVLYKEVLKANSELAKVVLDTTLDELSQAAEYRKKRLRLQRAVGQLMCNQLILPRTRARNWNAPGRPLRQSLSNYMEGKKGLINGNLLGKRTDYSGRAVIVPDPNLLIDTCRLPLSIAAKMYKPQLLAALRRLHIDNPEEQIAKSLEGEARACDMIRDALSSVVAERPVLLSRQPSLHRLSLLAFNAELGAGDVIAISPLVTKGYNADFDGDQMAVFLPITPAAIEEAKAMLPSRNLWHPANGNYALSLDQDIALGSHIDGKGGKQNIINTLARETTGDELVEEIERVKSEAFEVATQSGTSFSLGELKELSAEYDNQSGSEPAAHRIRDIVLAKDDMNVFKRIIVSGARGDWDSMNYLVGRANVNRPNSNLAVGLETGEQLYQAFFGRRNLVDTKLSTAEGGSLTKELVTRAHGTWITQDNCGTDAGVPVRTFEHVWLCLKRVPPGQEKMTVEAHLGSGRVDALLRGHGVEERVESGDTLDLTEQPSAENLVEWHDEIMAALDKHPSSRSENVVAVRIIRRLADEKDQLRELMFRRLYGRILSTDISDSFPTGTRLDYDKASQLAEGLAQGEINEVMVRSPLTCDSKAHGICRTCYGLEWDHGRYVQNWESSDGVEQGTMVGVIAAQSVGEPGTQMALRRKHAAGMTSDVDESWASTESVRDLFGIDELDPIQIRDTLDYIYRANNIVVAPVHFETLIRSKPIGGWLSSAADTFARKDLHKVICSSAIKNQEDRLIGAKERVVIGAGLPE